VALTADWHATGMHTTAGALVAGEQLSSTGVQPGTIVTEVDEEAGTFELSAPPTVTGLANDLSADLPATAPRSATQQMATLQEALERLPSIGTGNIQAFNNAEEEREQTATKLVQPLRFSGALAERPLEVISCDGSGLTGSSPTCSLEEIARGHRSGIFRYHPDGSPAPFSGLGENVIDGQLGYGGRPCSEEASSCDKTPQGGFENGVGNFQVAVDPTNGDIYITQRNKDLVDIFSAEGRYLGQLTAAGLKNLENPEGIAVDPSGAIYLSGIFGGNTWGIAKYIPHSNPPVNADGTAVFPVLFESEGSKRNGVGQLAIGAGSSAGWIFAQAGNANGGRKLLLKINEETGQFTEFAVGYGQQLAVDPTSGNPIAAIEGSSNEFAELDGSPESTDTVLSRLIVRSPESSAGTLAVGSSGVAYVTVRVHAGSNILVYGSSPVIVPTVTVAPATGVNASEATLNGTVDPEETNVGECFFEWGPTNAGGFTSWEHTVPCEGMIPPDSSEHTVHATISGLIANGARYSFRLAAKNENGTERSGAASFETASTVTTEVATVTGRTTATLNGVVHPEGSQYTECVFEWGRVTAPYEHVESCRPEAGDIPPDRGEHAVSLPLSGLQEATIYRFRLKATNGEGTVAGSELTFETFGPPEVTALRAGNATQSDATIEAEIDPGGFDASYWFEWGSGTGYGHVVPAGPKSIGSGQAPVRVSAELGGLTAGTTYHYRVIAEGEGGTVESPDQTFETLNSCGLPEARCYELVSRRESGPIAVPGVFFAALEMHFQAGDQGSGALAYVAEAGYPEATKGGEVLYRGTRNAAGQTWESTQLSAPIVAANEKKGEESNSGTTEWLSDDLSCGFSESWQPLTEDPATRLATEAGGSNLYRINPDGTYTAVSGLAPENPEAANNLSNFTVIGASQNCGKVIFSTLYRYPGLSGSGLYEWDEGVLRDPGVIPGPSGETRTSASVKSVSEDGSRVFFTATRQVGRNPGEVGKQGVFVREDATTTRDISLSETSTADSGATYQWATPGGSTVFFTANAGLTQESSSEGTDLYEYDFAKPEGERLTDLSVDHDTGGAAVNAFLGASEDGSSVYFTAKGQLIPGHGRTFADDQSAGTSSVYHEDEGTVSFAFTLGEVAPGERESFEVSSDGRYLLFESSGNYTGYVSGGANEAYLYDAKAAADPLVCVSCRPDGRSSAAPAGYAVLVNRAGIGNKLHPSRHLAVREGRAQVFFSSPDSLAPGAVENQNNVYEWSHGQVFRLASAKKGQQSPKPISSGFALPVGTSADGSNAYFVTPETLNWEDGDARSSVYDARIGGGFPESPPPPAACDPTAEGSCQGPTAQGPASPSVDTTSHSGPGNVKEKAPTSKCPEGKVRRHGRCVKKPHKLRHKQRSGHQKKGKGKKQKRHARDHGGAGK
jgi:hypothetical protein